MVPSLTEPWNMRAKIVFPYAVDPETPRGQALSNIYSQYLGYDRE